MARILIVDDSPTEIHVLKTMLDKHGFETFSAESGEDGVVKAGEEMPDLILMDIVMPGMNGFQATRKISTTEETKNIPIIIVTTKDQETDRVWGLRQGAKDFLTKPVTEKNLMDKINAALEVA